MLAGARMHDYCECEWGGLRQRNLVESPVKDPTLIDCNF